MRLRRTPALIDVLGHLVHEPGPVWGLAVSVATGRPTGTVYPLLVRLEDAGLVVSGWEPGNDRPGPRRRLYTLTGRGWAWAQEVCAEGPVRVQGRAAMA